MKRNRQGEVGAQPKKRRLRPEEVQRGAVSVETSPKSRANRPVGRSATNTPHNDLEALSKAVWEWLLKDPQGHWGVESFFALVHDKQKPLFIDRQGDATYYTNPPPLVRRLLVNRRSDDGESAREGVKWSTEIMHDLVKQGKIHHATDANIVRFDKELKARVSFSQSGEAIRLEDYERLLGSKSVGATNGDNDDASSTKRRRTEEDKKKNQQYDGTWSVRFLRPQEHVPALSALVFATEEVFACSGGMNSYWTPPFSQGFAPHYDDVDVFMLQLEGSKRWKLYNAPRDVDALSRHSSPDYLPEELPAKGPDQTVILKAGDLLYLPRGTVHQGDTNFLPKEQKSEQQHSLHITLSATQMHSYADLLHAIYRNKIETQAANDVELRRAIPRPWCDIAGSAINPKMMGAFAVPLSTEEKSMRKQFLTKIRKFTCQIEADIATKDGVIDKGCDAFGRDVLARRQPLPTGFVDRQLTTNLGDDSEKTIKLLSRKAVRVTLMGEEVHLHHCASNSPIVAGPLAKPRYLQQNDDTDEQDAATNMLRFDVLFAPAICHLVAMCPKAVSVSDLPFPDLTTGGEEGEEEAAEPVEERTMLCEALVEAGVCVWC